MHPGPYLEFGDRSGGLELYVKHRARWSPKLDPGEGCARSVWVKKLDEAWDGPVGLGPEQLLLED